MIKKPVTMTDIAKLLNVSTVTVSKALNEREGVSHNLRLQIKEKAGELGYRPCNSAKYNSPSNNVSIVVAKRFVQDTSTIYWIVYRHIVEMLQKENFYAILNVVPEPEEIQYEMPNSVSNKKIDGVIILGQLGNSYINNLLSLNMPTVFVDFCGNSTSNETILADNFYGSYLITNYLIKKGHKNIGFIGNIHVPSSAHDRYLGYYKALLENGIPLRNELIVNNRTSTFRLPKKLPTAFVCSTDELAYLLINRLKEKGLKTPDDISVVGYGNSLFSTISAPQITTIDLNSIEIAKKSAEIILKKIRDKSFSCDKILISGKLIERQSVKYLRENDE